MPDFSGYLQAIVFAWTTKSRLLFWSTFENLNDIINEEDDLTAPMVASVDVDNNHEGKNDYLEATLSFPLEDDETVKSVNSFFFFDVKLRLFSRLSVHGVANMQQQVDFGASNLIVSGDLIVVQKNNLPYKGSNDEFNAPLIDEATSVSSFDLNGLMQSYTALNLSTVFVYNYNGWQGESAENDFKLKISINYPK